MNTLGHKLKVFRKLRGLSQLELETSIGLSNGVISRIENNEINPTKETILKISQVLNLNNIQLEYLIGYLSEPATAEEISRVKVKLNPHINKSTCFAYVLDDRHRFIELSKGFRVATQISDKVYNQILLKHTPFVFLNEEFPLAKYIDGPYKEDHLIYRFLEVYQDMYFMDGDESFEELMRFVNSREDAKFYWKKAAERYENLLYRSYSEKELKLSMFGTKFSIDYSVERVNSFQRFRIIEFRATNRLINIMHKFLNEFVRS